MAHLKVWFIWTWNVFYNGHLYTVKHLEFVAYAMKMTTVFSIHFSVEFSTIKNKALNKNYKHYNIIMIRQGLII